MRITLSPWRIVAWAGLVLLAPLAEAAVSPRIAVVLSREMVAYSSYISQRAGYGWMGVAALAGVPYETLFVEDLGDDGTALAKKYSALVLPELHALTSANYEGLTRTLIAYREVGGAIVLDGPPGIWNEAGEWRGDGPLHDALDCGLGGFVGDSRYRVTIAGGAGGTHDITRGWSDGEAVTHPFTIGFNAVIPQTRGGAGIVLLEARAAGEEPIPWLSCTDDGRSRVVLIGGVFGAGDVASLFRNGEDHFPDPPNRVHDVLVTALQWALYGDDAGPIPALQFCAADAAVMIRLDGDHSNRPSDVTQTFSYLMQIAEESGVAAAYGIVTSRAAETGWAQFAPLAKRLEERGGEIGTHTHSHDIYGVVDEEIALRELDASIRAIEHDLEVAGYDAEGVPFLINPNGMIPMTAYGEIAARFPLFLTHGISSAVPVAYGVSSWLAESDPPFVVIYDSPEPDFQWLYDREWSYTAAEAASIETAIFRHYMHSIRRGVLFDMMWHDYGISSSGYDQSRPDFRWADLFMTARKKSASNLPLFDALSQEFRSARVYCPQPLEAAEKLRIMQSANYEWAWSDSILSMTLDLSELDEARARQTAGMGIRIDRSEKPIRTVTIDGVDHAAFRTVGTRGGGANVVILPALAPGVHRFEIDFGHDPAARAHMTYVSKPLVSIRRGNGNDDLSFTIECEGLARFELEVPEGGSYVTGADRFDFGVPFESGGHRLAGSKLGSGTFALRFAPDGFPPLRHAVGPVVACDRDAAGKYAITAGSGRPADVALVFTSAERIVLTGPDGRGFVSIPGEARSQTVTIPGPVPETRFTLTVEGGS